MNKIAVYTICKNEEKHVDKWLESMSEADYMCVLDTGSTDGTYDLLVKRTLSYPNLIVKHNVVEPFRFDVARNLNIDFIPDDANILMENDLDEWLEPGWAQPLRERWIDGRHTRGEYNYVWSHLSNGANARVFKYNKIHTKDWRWTAPVHEYLARNKDPNYSVTEMCDLTDCITLHHYPDYSKPRSNYLELLKLRAKEDPDDIPGKCYLADQHYYLGQYNESIAALNDLITNWSHKFVPYEMANLHLVKAECYSCLKQDKNAEDNFQLAIQHDPTLREPYILYAQWLLDRKQYDLAIGYVNEGIKRSTRKYVYTERDTTWSYLPYDILAQAYYWIGNKEKSLNCAVKAASYNDKDERLIKNVKLIMEELYGH